MNILETIDKSKIRVVYEYEFCRGTNASQTARIINEVFGDNVANERTMRRWFDRFRSGDFSLENQPRGWPATKIDNADLKAVVEEQRFSRGSALAERFNVSNSHYIGPSETDRKGKKAG